jgi:hypothetical protein
LQHFIDCVSEHLRRWLIDIAQPAAVHIHPMNADPDPLHGEFRIQQLLMGHLQFGRPLFDQLFELTAIDRKSVV